GHCPSARSGAAHHARSAAGAGGRDRKSGLRARLHARKRGDRARFVQSAPWAARSMPGQFRHTWVGIVGSGQWSAASEETREEAAVSGGETERPTICLFLATGHWSLITLHWPLATIQKHIFPRISQIS